MKFFTIKSGFVFGIVLMPLVNFGMQQSITREKAFFADGKNFSFRSANAFKPLETVAVKNIHGDLVMGTIVMKQPFTQDRYIVQVAGSKEPYPISSIGKLKESMSAWEKIKGKLSKATQPQSPSPVFKLKAREVLGFEENEGVTPEHLSIHYTAAKKTAQSNLNKNARAREGKIVDSSYKALRDMNRPLGKYNKESVREFQQAIRQHDLLRVRTLLRNGANVNDWNHKGLTPLFYAIGDRDMMRELLNAGADVNVRSSNGYTPLLFAAMFAGLDSIRELLNAGADVRARNSDGCTPLLLAIKNNYSDSPLIDIIKEFLRAGVDVTARDKDGATVLMEAAWERNVDTIRFLLAQRGTDINAKDKYGGTALMVVTRRYMTYHNPHDERRIRCLGVIKELLKAGADVGAKTNKGETVLMFAEREAKQIIQDFVNIPLLQAAQDASYEKVTQALQKGANVNATDEKGNTALHLVAGVTKLTVKDVSRRLDRAALVTSFLLRKKALITKNKDDETPLDIATAIPGSPIVKVYEDYARKRPDIKDALDLAVRKHEMEAQELRQAAEEAAPREEETMTQVIARELAGRESLTNKDGR